MLKLDPQKKGHRREEALSKLELLAVVAFAAAVASSTVPDVADAAAVLLQQLLLLFCFTTRQGQILAVVSEPQTGRQGTRIVFGSPVLSSQSKKERDGMVGRGEI